MVIDTTYIEYLGGAIIVVLFIVFYSVIAKRKKAGRIINEIRNQWGKEKEEYRNFEKIRLYSDNIRDNSYHEISDQTKSDIDFYELFSFVDRANSKIGQQYLFNLLQRPVGSIVELQKLDSQVQFFNSNQSEREKIQLELDKLNSDKAYAVSSLISDNLPQKPTWHKWLVIDIIALILCLLLSIKFPIFIIYSLLIAAVNVFVLSNLNKRHLLLFTNSLPQLHILISTARKLSKIKHPFEKDQVYGSLKIFRNFQRKISILYFGYEQKGTGDISQLPLYLFDLVKSIFLVEAFTLFSLLKSIQHYRSNIIYLFQYVGKIDTAISIASLRHDKIKTCTPVFINKKKSLSITNGIHPLVADCVPNSIKILNKSVLLTGSNMSGKTTFLRMVAINSLLSQTLYTCFADEYVAPFFKTYSSVRIDDNLFQGKSYFFQEVSTMSSLINAVNSEHQNLYILDELFKGTNTIERIAAAKAILSYLNKHEHIVFVSTHDVELTAMLENEYQLYHFTETVNNDGLDFDHKIKPGALKTRNAIKILDMLDFPEEIISEAKIISSSFSNLIIK
jgi:DNA mismatch repair ATPase MutS